MKEEKNGICAFLVFVSVKDTVVALGDNIFRTEEKNISEKHKFKIKIGSDTVFLK